VQCELVLQEMHGGSWKYPIDFLIRSAEFEDLYVLEGPVGQTTQLSITKKNETDKEIPFEIVLSDSDNVFGISPLKGSIKIEDGESLPAFVISFNPRELTNSTATFTLKMNESILKYQINGNATEYYEAPIQDIKHKKNLARVASAKSKESSQEALHLPNIRNNRSKLQSPKTKGSNPSINLPQIK
jgi:hypothetical protein